MAKRKGNIISPVDEVNDFKQDINTNEEITTDRANGRMDFFKDERLPKIFGLVIVLTSIYTFFAVSSFLFTWDKDQSLVLNLGWDMFLSNDPGAAENLLGKIGAWFGYHFVYNGIGICAYLISLLLLAIGTRLLTGFAPIPIVKSFQYGVLITIWLPLLLGFIFQHEWQLLGGIYGHFGYLYLNGLIGGIGTGFLLACYPLLCLVAIFNIKFYEPTIVNNTEFMMENVKDVPTRTEEEETFLDQLDPESFVLKQNEVTAIDEEIDFKEPEVDSITKLQPIELPDIATSELVESSSLILEVQEIPDEEVVVELKQDSPVYGSIDSAYDPTLDFPNYQFPTIDLLTDYGENKSNVEQAELQAKTKMIEDTLKNYNIAIKKISATIGPTVTLYEIVPQDGVRIAKIKNLEDDIALSLAALGIRIIAPIPGRGTIGIEVPNEKPAMVSMRSVLTSSKFQHAEMDLPVAFGKNIQNEVFVADLAKMPHLLMAGATGQGKSVGLNAILVSLLYKKHPSQIKFVLVDPKKVELSIYKTIERHFLAKIPGDADAIITDTKLVVNTLNSLCVEMDNRYDLLKDAGVRNLKEYNMKFVSRRLVPSDKMPHRFLPFIVVVIDEVADLMMTAGKEVEMPIARIAQLARAVGIHMILATQRPSVNVITGMIKANFPARVAFRVSQKTDSRTILDANGADQLIGKGDMLYTVGNDLMRLQCAFVDTPEVDRIAHFIGNQLGKEPYALPEVKSESEDGINEDIDPRERDSLFEEAAQIIVQHQQGSTSLLQRRLNLGYNRAGRLIDQLEKAGIVGPFKGSKAREVLIQDIIQLENKLAELRGE
jgi:S-DNA-T family DNA segregation ATPase FtsK/SpoIIIE